MAMFSVFVSAFSDYKGKHKLVLYSVFCRFSPTHQQTVRYGISNFIPLCQFCSDLLSWYCLVKGNWMGFWWLEIQIYKLSRFGLWVRFPVPGCVEFPCSPFVCLGGFCRFSGYLCMLVMHASLVHLLACGYCIFSPLDGDHTSRRSSSLAWFFGDLVVEC